MLRISVKNAQFGRVADVRLIGGYSLGFFLGFCKSSMATHTNGADRRVWIHASCKETLYWHRPRPEQATLW